MKPLRGLSVEEALIQLSFADQPKAYLVANVIRGAARNAVHNFNMEKDRLYIRKFYS